MPRFWLQTPSDKTLSEMVGWAEIGKNRFAAIRHHLLIVQKSGTTARNGPIYKQMDWPIKAKFQLQDKITRVTKYTSGLQESITSAITTQLSHEILTKVGASGGVSLAVLEAKINSELQAKVGAELIESLQNGLSLTRTYEISASQEKTKSFEFEVAAADGSGGVRPVYIYFKLKPFFWDVYLYQTDYLQLEYRRQWIWPTVRQTIVSAKVTQKRPLFRIVYYEPFEEFSVKYDHYEPDVQDDELVMSLPLTTSYPGGQFASPTSLESLARLAFPVSKKEKAEKQKRAKSRIVSKRPAARNLTKSRTVKLKTKTGTQRQPTPKRSR